MPDIWRTGRKVGRTIYAQAGPDPSDDDPLIGVMDTPQLAEKAVAAVNRARRSAADPEPIADILWRRLNHTWCDDCHPGPDWPRALASEVVNARLSADQDDLDALEAALVTAADYIQTQMDARPASQCPRMRATDHAVLLAAIRRAVTTYLDQADHRETEVLATELATERTLHQQTLATLARVREMHVRIMGPTEVGQPDSERCDACLEIYPCPTIRAIEESTDE